MAEILRNNGTEIFYLEDPSYYWTNLTFTRDVALMLPKGVVLTRFAMYFHQGDTCITQKFMAEQGIPIIGAIQGHGGGRFLLHARCAYGNRRTLGTD